MKVPFLPVFVCIGLCAASFSAGALSATRDVIAIMAGELFVGEAEGHLDGSGTLSIHSKRDPALVCIGNFVTSAKQGGAGQLKCSDGSEATFRIVRLTIFRGHGTGKFSRGAMTFAYGLTPDEALPYLTLPAGKRLVQNGTELQLADY